MNYTIYTKPKCQYCDKVKDLLKNENSIYIDCSNYLQDTTKQLFLQFIQDTANLSEPYKTFPMVFCNGRFIGGFTETKLWYEQHNFTTKRDF